MEKKPEAKGTELAVCEDIASRQEMGINKYGVQVANNNLSHRQWLQHAYEGALDKSIYLKQCLLTHSDAQQDVIDFMLRAGQEVPERPKIPDEAVRMLRLKLIAEELNELAKAFAISLQIIEGEVVLEPNAALAPSLVEAYDAVLDLLVVVIGSGVAIGVDIQPGWKEVHRSNMSKFIDGHRREDGKWVKGPSYSPANLQPIIDSQLS